MQGIVWEQTSYYSFSYGNSDYPESMEYRVFDPNSQGFELHSIYDELKWKLEQSCEFFDRILTGFKWYNYNGGMANYMGYDSCVVNNNNLIKRISFRNGRIESRNSYNHDQNNNLTEQIIEQIRGIDLDTVSIISNQYAYTTNGEITEIIRRRQNFQTGTDFTNKTNYYYFNSGLSKNKTASHFHIYPNPAQNFIKFEMQNGPNEVKIYNLSGKLIKQIETSQNVIEIADLIPGVYVLEIKNEQGLFHSKLIKE